MSRIDTRHDRLVIALLQSRTVADAARASGMAERHVWRLLVNPLFKTKLDEARNQVFSAALNRIQAGISDATAVLLDVLHAENNPPSVKVTAARTLLEAALQVWEITNLERRLAALEDRLKNENRS